MSGSLRPAAPLSPPLALGWSLALTFGLNGTGLLVAKLLGGSAASMLALAVLEVALYVSAAFALGRFYVGPERRVALALGGARPLELLLGGSLGVILHLPAGYLDALVERSFPTPRARLLEQMHQLTPTSSAHAVALLLGVALLAPLAEELFFRGALFTALSRHSPAFVAIWTSSIAFVLAHQEPRMWAPLLVVALVLGELRRLSGSLWAGFALHAAFNATTLLSVFAAKTDQLEAPQVSWAMGAIGTVLSGLGIWVFGRVTRARGAGAV